MKILKTYIENNLVNGFIQLSKSLVKALILFDQKQNDFFQLYINFWNFNNLIIKN